MRPFLRRFLKLSTALSFLILNPRRGFIKLLEEQQNHLTSPHNFLRRISLEQLHKGELPEVKFVSFLGGGSSPTDCLLLLIIAKQFKKFSYLEIGTWRGESIRNILESPNCEKAVSVTLDPLKWGGLTKV